MDSQPRDELKATLRTMQHLAVTYSFETAIEALDAGIRINRTGFTDTAVLAARISEYGLDTEAYKGPDLKVYDTFLDDVAAGL